MDEERMSKLKVYCENLPDDERTALIQMLMQMAPTDPKDNSREMSTQYGAGFLDLAKQLPEGERVNLVEALMMTLPEHYEQSVSDEELDRRRQSIEDGTVKGIPAEQVRERLRSRVAARSAAANQEPRYPSDEVSAELHAEIGRTEAPAVDGGDIDYTELDRRRQEVEDGTVKLIPAQEVFAKWDAQRRLDDFEPIKPLQPATEAVTYKFQPKSGLIVKILISPEDLGSIAAYREQVYVEPDGAMSLRFPVDPSHG